MARVTAPLLSLNASGTIASTVTYAHWKGRRYARITVVPHNPESGLQVGMRAVFKFVTQAYAALSATIKGHWLNAAKPDNITALDADVRLNQTRARQNFGYREDPTFTAGAVEAAPAAPSATAQPKSLKIAWTDSVGADDRATYVYMSTTPGFSPDISNLQAVIAHGVQQVTITELTTGTTYSFKVGGVEKGGTLGTLSAQFQGTPT